MDDLMPAGSSPWPAPSFTKPDRVSSRTCKKMGACIRFGEGGGGEMKEKRRGGAGMRMTTLADLGGSAISFFWLGEGKGGRRCGPRKGEAGGGGVVGGGDVSGAARRGKA